MSVWLLLLSNALLIFQILSGYIIRNRLQVQDSAFRVKDKDGIEGPKFSIKMLIFQNICQFGFKSWLRPDEADAFLENTYPRRSSGTRMER